MQENQGKNNLIINIKKALRNDSNIISRGFVAKNGYWGKWNYRSIPKLKFRSYIFIIPKGETNSYRW